MIIGLKRKLILGISVMGLLMLGLQQKDKALTNLKFNRPDPDSLQWVSTSKGKLHIKTYKSDTLKDSLHLVIVVHGDSPFNKPGYQYLMAKKIAGNSQNTVAVGVLRPGYEDPAGNKSAGEKGLAVGDNYTPEVIEAIAEVILNLKKRYSPLKTTLVGHSGGGAIVGNIAGSKPEIVDHAILVSCPCDVSKWRKYMGTRQKDNPHWLGKTPSLSPISVAGGISDATTITIIVGEKDDITPAYLSKEYYLLLKNLKKNVKLVIISGEGHEVLLHQDVMNEIIDGSKK